MSALVFMDTETTGLDLDDDIWEFAAIRREEDGTEAFHHLFVEHDLRKAEYLPESFRADHKARFPRSNTDGPLYSRAEAAYAISRILSGDPKPHIVGAVPNFDAERLALLLREHGHEPGWHYHLIDVENLAVGYIVGRWGTKDEAEARAVSLPWDSNNLSRAVGVEPPGEGERHTAMGDARWALALYDAVMERAQ